jgi:hypothetical protein
MNRLQIKLLTKRNAWRPTITKFKNPASKAVQRFQNSTHIISILIHSSYYEKARSTASLKDRHTGHHR